MPAALAPGDSHEMQAVVTADVVDAFARATGDSNPVHLDEAFAATTSFGRRIAHGMLGASYISAVLGTRMPGPGSIYLSQSLRFVRPIFLGDTVTTRVEILTIRPDKPIVTVRTTCTNQEGAVVIEGEAVLRVPLDVVGGGETGPAR